LRPRTYINCSNCLTDVPSISIYCRNCSRFVIKLNWFSALIFFLSLGLIAYILVETDLLWVGSLYAEILVLILLGIILRYHMQVYGSFIFYNVIPTSIVFISNYELFGIDTANRINLAILIILAVYFPAAYLIHFNWIRKIERVDIIKGLSVYSFFIYIYAIIFLKINSALNLISEEVILFIEERIHFRTLLLITLLILVMFISFISALKKKISEPKNVFEKGITVASHSIKSNNTIFRIILTYIVPFYEIIEKIFVVIINAILELINTIKKTIEYLIKMLHNYIVEIIYLIKQLAIVFLKSIFSFVILALFPLLIFYFIANDITRLVDDLIVFIKQNNNLGYLISVAKHVIFMLGAIFVLIMTRSRYPIGEIYKNIMTKYNYSILDYDFGTLRDGVFYIYAVFIFAIYVGAIISSYSLYLMSNFIKIETYEKIGFFGLWGSIVLVISFIVILTRARIITEKDDKDGEHNTKNEE